VPADEADERTLGLMMANALDDETPTQEASA
jgi:hypothetical protein